jgi:hypothetical protein
MKYVKRETLEHRMYKMQGGVLRLTRYAFLSQELSRCCANNNAATVLPSMIAPE